MSVKSKSVFFRRLLCQGKNLKVTVQITKKIVNCNNKPIQGRLASPNPSIWISNEGMFTQKVEGTAM